MIERDMIPETSVIFNQLTGLIAQADLINFSRRESFRSYSDNSLNVFGMKTYVGVGVQTHVLLTSALVGGEWSASLPGRFTPGERVPCTHWL
jgi:hypothetical protein